MTVPNPTTLQAINAILRSIAQTGLVSYPSASPSEDELAAGEALDESVRFLEMRDDFPWAMKGDWMGLDWSGALLTLTESAGKISLAAAGSLPYVVMRVELHPDDSEYGEIVVEARDDSGTRRLYNATAGTFVWPTGTGKKVFVTFALDFGLLPPPAQHYCIHRASARMVAWKLMDATRVAMAERDMARAWEALVRWSLKSQRLSLLDAPGLRGTHHPDTY